MIKSTASDLSTLNDTPRANRLHIGLYGKRNSGKSSLLNSLTGQQVSLVSPAAGTTTDPVYKAMELHGIGACVFIDTPGFDDVGALGRMRVEQTAKALEKTDIALLLISADELSAKHDSAPLRSKSDEFPGQTSLKESLLQELEWHARLKSRGIPTLLLISKTDLAAEPPAEQALKQLETLFDQAPLCISTRQPETIEAIRQALLRALPEDFEKSSITGSLASAGDLVLLVMPQDIQAPKGRLILPQVQTIRDLLDKKCIVTSCTADTLDQALHSLSQAPDLIITDSQIFKTVFEKKPQSSKLTSFSILFAGYKGDLDYYTASADAIDHLTERSKILIAEACAHAPLSEDIGRVKLPRLLREKAGEGLTVDFVRGTDFPAELSGYDLIIQCGACMFNRRYVLSRIQQAKEQQVPMTNYGVAIAHLSRILKHLKF